MAGLRVFGRALTTTPVFGPSPLPRLSLSLIRPDTLAASTAHRRIDAAARRRWSGYGSSEQHIGMRGAGKRLRMCCSRIFAGVC